MDRQTVLRNTSSGLSTWPAGMHHLSPFCLTWKYLQHLEVKNETLPPKQNEINRWSVTVFVPHCAVHICRGYFTVYDPVQLSDGTVTRRSCTVFNLKNIS